MADERYVTQDQFGGRNMVNDERFRRDKERLDNQESDIRDVRKLTVQMGEMIKRHDSQIDGHERRITSLERQPSEQYGKVKTAIVTAIISGIVGFIISAVLASAK